MNDLFLNYNTTSDLVNNTKLQFFVNRNNDGWNIKVNNSVDENFQIIMCTSDEDVWYELYKGNDKLEYFEFPIGGLSYLPNLATVANRLQRYFK